MKKADEAIPNTKLKQERVERNWTQGQVAEKIGTSRVNVSRWEHGRVLPEMYFRQQLCELFGKNAYELGLLPEHASANGEQPVHYAANTQGGPSTVPATSSPLWHVPYRRNPFFTGREEILQLLHDALHRRPMTALIQSAAISGLGGIGKTQTAIEYAYRYRKDYQAVLWTRAETRETLIADLIALAETLHLPERNDPDQRHIVEAIKRWLHKHDDWLLILDNVEDFLLVADILPSECQGHAMLTTRAQATGLVTQRIDLAPMEPDEGAFFLLRRAKLLGQDTPFEEVGAALRDEARSISHSLDGLPLPLDQAGAYIEETGCSLDDYLNRYKTRHTALLNRRGNFATGHPESVNTTLSLCIEKVKQVNSAAAELLRLCAFLHPDAIPEEIIIEGAPNLGVILQAVAADSIMLDDTLAVLRNYSLLRRNVETKTLTIHRLVQTVLKDSMDEKIQYEWAERAVHIISRVFLDVERSIIDSQYQRYLPQAHVCANLVEQWHMEFPEAARLLHHLGIYMREYADYTQAELLLEKACAIRTRVLGTEHPDLATSLNELAAVYRVQSKYTLAEPLYLQALAIRKQRLGPEHLDVAQSLNDLALLYRFQGKYGQAEPLFQRSLAICELMSSSKPLALPTVLNNFALFYDDQGKYTQAEQLHKQALVLWEQILEPEHPSVALALNNLAFCYNIQGRYEQAEPLHLQALAIRKKTLGPEHPDVANSLNNLAWLYNRQGRYEQAEPLHLQALAIRKKTLGPEHPDVAVSLSNLAKLYYAQGKYEQAEPLHLQALAIRKKTLGLEHPDVAVCLSDLAMLYLEQERYEQAASLFIQALESRKKALGPEHPNVADSLHNLARLYSVLQAYAQAEPLYQRALAIWEKALEPDHPSIISCLENYAELLRKTHRECDAASYEARIRQLRAS